MAKQPVEKTPTNKAWKRSKRTRDLENECQEKSGVAAILQLQRIAGNGTVLQLLKDNEAGSKQLPSDPLKQLVQLKRRPKADKKNGSTKAATAAPAKQSDVKLHLDEDPPYCCDKGKELLAQFRGLASPDDAPADAKQIYDDKKRGIPEAVNLSVSAKMPDGSQGPKNKVKGLLVKEAQANLEDMLRAASAAGGQVEAGETFRDLKTQWLYWHRKHSRSRSFVAWPGSSNHGTGRAIDFHASDAGYTWLLEHAGNYGWLNLPTERWHYDHVSTQGIFEKNKGMIEGGTERKQKSGGSASPLTEDEKTALLSQFEEARVFVAVPWNQNRNYSRDTWLKVQEAVGMPVKERTGSVDEATVRAVMAWQKKQPKTEVDGKVGPKMLKAFGIADKGQPASNPVQPLVTQPTGSNQNTPAAATVKHYSLKSSKIVLSPDVEQKVREIADAYYEKTKRNIVITDGTRKAADQADRMFTKLRIGDDVVALYKNKDAAKAVKEVYDKANADKKPDEQIKAAMTAVIEEQIKQGVYISNHLEAGAVDVRKRDMSKDEKKTFIEVAEAKGVHVLEEAKPPHLHLKVK
ncbi:MAG TPA: D-alanyl-D-alanine carboxypeptidase family protein [Anaerolineales bacterium]|nr:D-alanyl-D-alanine carboxypeptidase family protein [Anaerolineales bacterium]